MSIKERHAIRSSEIRDIIDNLKSELGEEIEEISDKFVEIIETSEKGDIIAVDGVPYLVKKDEKFFPLIPASEDLSIRRVTVDMGAIEPISTGADIMAPGIVEVEEGISEGDIVAIDDEENRKVLAIGSVIVDSSELTGEGGKVIEN
ncbi:MAG: DUF1947 domain-containing protein, partial [Candidatus Aenigmatarchaeota archaeon]